MTTPLFHLTQPDDGSDAARLAPLQIALEMLAALDEWHLRRSLRQVEKGLSDVVFPPLYASRVRYTPGDRHRPRWLDMPKALMAGLAGGADLAAWRAAELRISGVDAEPVIARTWVPGRRTGSWGTYYCVRYPDGRIEDPSSALGRAAGDLAPDRLAEGPLVELSLPDSDDGAHFAPLQIALEGLCQIDEWHIRRSLRRLEKGLSATVIPPLYMSGVVYQEEPPGHEDWPDIHKLLESRWGDCEDLAAWRAAELRVAGFPVEPVIKWQWVPREQMIAQGYPPSKLPGKGVWLVHCCVRWPGGWVEDPSKVLGMGGNFTQRI